MNNRLVEDRQSNEKEPHTHTQPNKPRRVLIWYLNTSAATFSRKKCLQIIENSYEQRDFFLLKAGIDKPHT